MVYAPACLVYDVYRILITILLCITLCIFRKLQEDLDKIKLQTLLSFVICRTNIRIYIRINRNANKNRLRHL